MKRLILVLVVFYPLFSFAQFSDYYNYYLYIPRGETASSTKSVQYVHFDRNEKLYCSHILNTTLKRIYKEGIIDEYAVNKSHNFKYDTKTSTYKYEVYVEKRDALFDMPEGSLQYIDQLYMVYDIQEDSR